MHIQCLLLQSSSCFNWTLPYDNILKNKILSAKYSKKINEFHCVHFWRDESLNACTLLEFFLYFSLQETIELHKLSHYLFLTQIFVPTYIIQPWPMSHFRKADWRCNKYYANCKRIFQFKLIPVFLNHSSYVGLQELDVLEGFKK